MKEKKSNKVEEKIVAGCSDRTCPIHGALKVRGRQFKGYIIRKLPKRIVIEFERIIFIQKYERYMKKKTKIHARLPDCMKDDVKVGDYVLVGECRPISKIVHFVYLNKIREEQK